MFKIASTNLKASFAFPALSIVSGIGCSHPVVDTNDIVPSLIGGLLGILVMMLMYLFIPSMEGPKSPLPLSMGRIQYAFWIYVSVILMAFFATAGYGIALYFRAEQISWFSLFAFTTLRNLLLAPLLAYWGWNVHSKLPDLNNIEFDPIRSP